MQNWYDRSTLQAQLGISRSAFFRRVKAGHIEKATLGGATVYRPATSPTERDSASRESRDPSGTAASHQVGLDGTVPGPGGTSGTELDAGKVLALVAQYEARIDALLASERQARADASELRVEVEQARRAADAERHRLQLAQLEAQQALDQERTRARLAEVTVNQERSKAQQARAEAEALRARLEALQATPWWAFGRRRELRAMLA